MSIIDGDTNRLNFDGERTKPHSVYVFEWTATAKSSNSLSSSDAVVLETAKLPTVLSLEIDKETSEYLTDALTLSMTTVVTAAADYAFYYQRGESERVLLGRIAVPDNALRARVPRRDDRGCAGRVEPNDRQFARVPNGRRGDGAAEW